ncbi:uncharacterized protein UTRI_01642 [Ustilago trichophora]|uniref:F-box domain-containing protein n=1 Tax=Ustilago trichophora TaxID=86804 RepID=A0A5C3DWV9_9BASI|nr:uncharacterized protein UTRI_01642 [Ustilago trichophora]
MTNPPSEDPSPTLPRLPAEILAEIIELSILTSTPCPLVPDPSSSNGARASPFTTPLRASYTSNWAWTVHLLFVSKFFYSIARPLLLRTLTLDSDYDAEAFFAILEKDGGNAKAVLESVERAWLGNLSALGRAGLSVDPVELRLKEAGWYEECSGGFVVGHAYATRFKTRKGKEGTKVEDKGRERKYRSVSVYWAEEQLVEEVSDPEYSSTDDEGSETSSDDEQQDSRETIDFAQSLPSISISMQNGTSSTQRRRSHHEQGSARDPRLDRPHEPAWQTLYSRQRRTSPIRARGQPLATVGVSTTIANDPSSSSIQIGPSEGDLDPWDMQDAQERLAALANNSDRTHPSTSHSPIADTPLDTVDSAKPNVSTSALVSAQGKVAHNRRRRREIYAYHLCTATLEPWINPLLSSLRSLRLITLTFYPGHLLDDDKLEHMLRRILSPSECPRLEILLIRIVFDAASAGSRMRRFERTKTIAGAADRIGDERVRVMLVNDKVGEGELVALPRGEGHGKMVSPVSRKAITLTKEGWWARVVLQNHHQHNTNQARAELGSAQRSQEEAKRGSLQEKQERQLSDWRMFFPTTQVGPTHLVNLIHHCDPWPDCPDPVT